MNSRRDVFDQVKRATVALAFMRKTPGPRNRPFEILGSGFCVDPSGVVITCRHVIEAFMAKSAAEQIAAASESEKVRPIRKLGPVDVIPPQVMFFRHDVDPNHLVAAIIQARLIVAKTDRDLAVVRIDAHRMFPDGYPHLDLEESHVLFEGQEIATCGFPLGNFLSEQIGTVTKLDPSSSGCPQRPRGRLPT